MNIITPKVIRHWPKNLNKTQIPGKISCVHGSDDLILLKCPC